MKETLPVRSIGRQYPRWLFGKTKRGKTIGVTFIVTPSGYRVADVSKEKIRGRNYPSDVVIRLKKVI
jgi:hypothetical protein